MALDKALHKKIMFEMINKIYGSELAHSLAFKWWTYCLFAHKLDRFSVDLDFDLIDKKHTLDEIKTKLKKIVSGFWPIKEETKSKIIIKYEESWYPLKLEINKRIQQNDTYEIVNFFGRNIQAMTKESIFANKLYTIYERKKRADKVASRDLYDTRFFFKNNRNINTNLLEERANQTASTFLSFLKDFIPKHFTQENILRWLGELVNPKQKHFIKHKLIPEVISQIDFYLRNNSDVS